ncbi:MAG: RHS repeat-associated core domain-containing protein, partial [Nitrospina sp.]|nr:RHS repeat-associated core domain-containing protein [Nitrospina sp.]
RNEEESGYIHQDIRGSVLAKTSFTHDWTIPQLSGETEYDAWGNDYAVSALERPRHAFINHEPDPGTGHYHFGKRVYDPSLRRWLSPDPLFLSNPELDLEKGDELNLYQYAGNNPVKYVDPTGEIAWVPILLVAIPIIEGAADLVQLGVALYQATNNPTPSNIAGVGACAVDVVSPPGTPGSVLAEMNTARPKGTKTYQTYTKTNPKTGEPYTGRTSGTGTPFQNVAKRDSNHAMNKKGFLPAKLDKSSTNKDAIRGREQQLIEKNGGAKSKGGTSGNAINGISPKNKKKAKYMEEAKNEFGN